MSSPRVSAFVLFEAGHSCGRDQQIFVNSGPKFSTAIFSNCDVQPGLRNLDVELWDYASTRSQTTLTLNPSHRPPPPPRPLPGFPIRHSLPSTLNPLTPLFARLYSQLLSSQDFTRTWSSPLAPTPQKQRSYVLSTNKFFTGSISWKTEKAALISRSSGVRCGSPSLRGEQFCYYHQRMHRGVRTPPQSRLHPLACIEDKESIQAALAEVINALLRNTIEMKRATLIFAPCTSP